MGNRERLPAPALAAAPTRAEADDGREGEPSATVASTEDGVVLAFDVRGLAALAERSDCLIELVPEVGDFVAAGDPLFRVVGGRATVPEAALRGSVALGQERTVEQDPAFGLRILVDMASKGLSPGINDPTTAVLALDQIHHLLRSLGNRPLDHGRVRDASGRLRLLYRTPDWADFVQLAVTEIRQFGARASRSPGASGPCSRTSSSASPRTARPSCPELAMLRRSADRASPTRRIGPWRTSATSRAWAATAARCRSAPRRSGDPAMTADRLIGALVSVTCIAMMVAVGLGARLADLGRVGRDRRLLARVLVANYVAVPAATLALLVLVRPHPMVAAGFLILACVPGRRSGRRSPRSPGGISPSRRP